MELLVENYWWRIKFDGLAVCDHTAKLKSIKCCLCYFVSGVYYTVQFAAFTKGTLCWLTWHVLLFQEKIAGPFASKVVKHAKTGQKTQGKGTGSCTMILTMARVRMHLPISIHEHFLIANPPGT